jgi:hypothetical protein
MVSVTKTAVTGTIFLNFLQDSKKVSWTNLCDLVGLLAAKSLNLPSALSRDHFGRTVEHLCSVLASFLGSRNDETSDKGAVKV